MFNDIRRQQTYCFVTNCQSVEVSIVERGDGGLPSLASRGRGPSRHQISKLPVTSPSKTRAMRLRSLCCKIRDNRRYFARGQQCAVQPAHADLNCCALRARYYPRRMHLESSRCTRVWASFCRPPRAKIWPALFRSYMGWPPPLVANTLDSLCA